MKDKHALMLLVTVGIVLAGYLVFRQGTLSHGQPGTEPDGVVMGEIDFGQLQAGGQGDHFVMPAHHCGPVRYLPVRFPRHSGENVTHLIHHGYSSLMSPHFTDRAWAFDPPSEVSL